MMQKLREKKQGEEIVSEQQAIKYGNGTFYLVCFINTVVKVPKRVTYVDLSGSEDEQRNECFILHLNYKDEWDIPKEKDLVVT